MYQKRGNAIKYAFLSIIRYLNGDYDKGKELAKIAEEISYKDNHLFYKVGDVIPEEIKTRMYDIT